MICGAPALAAESSDPMPPISTPTPSASSRQATPATAAALVLTRPSQAAGPVWRTVVLVASGAPAPAGTWRARISRNGSRASARRVPHCRQ